MNTIGLGPPSIPSVRSHIEVTNSCNCCCFPFSRKRRVSRHDVDIVRVAADVFHSGKEINPKPIHVSETK